MFRCAPVPGKVLKEEKWGKKYNRFSFNWSQGLGQSSLFYDSPIYFRFTLPDFGGLCDGVAKINTPETCPLVTIPLPY